MNIKNLKLFQLFKDKYEIKDNVYTKEDKKIDYEDDILRVRIARWMSAFLTLDEYKSLNCIKNYSSVTTKDILKKTLLTEERLTDIDNEFMRLLNTIGIDEDETIKFTNYDDENFSVNCHLNKANKDALISFSYGYDDGNTMRIRTDNEDNIYNYCVSFDYKKANLFLAYSFKKNSDNGNIISKTFASYPVFILGLKDSNNELSIKIQPKYYCFGRPYVIREDKEGYDNELETMISQLEFPIDIKDVFDILCSYSGDLINDFKIIDIHYKNNNNKEERIVFENGELTTFTTSIINNNGDINHVSLDSNGKWSVCSPILDIKYYPNLDKGSIQYHLNNYDVNKLSILDTIAEQYMDAGVLVDEAKEQSKYYIDKISNKKQKTQ